MQALDNVRVLDLTHHIAGPYATKMLADLGADVIKVEAPGGDVARKLGPFKGDDPHPEKSGLFFFLNCNKRSVVLDLKRPEGREALGVLAARADLVVENFAPGTLDALGVGWEFFRGIRPDLPLVSISNFGQDGPYRDYKGSELVLYGFAGEMYSIGLPEREPVKMAGTVALFQAGAAAAAGIMGALFAAKKHGIGQHVDFAITEAHAGSVDRRQATIVSYGYSGRHQGRTTPGAGGMPAGVYPCADGYVDFTGATAVAGRVPVMLGNPEWLNDPDFSDPVRRFHPEVIERFNMHFLEWCLARTKREIWEEARRAKVMCGPLFTMEDMFSDEHFRSRGMWEKTEHPFLGEVELPGRQFLMQRGGYQLRRRAPLLGEHTREVLAEAGLPETKIAALTGEGR